MKFALRLVWVLAALLPALAFAHPANVPSALVKVGADRSIKIRLHCDILAYVLDSTPADISDGPMNALLDGAQSDLQARLNDARSRLAEQLIVKASGQEVKIDHVAFPTATEIAAYVKAGPKNRLPVMMTITAQAKLPKDAATLTITFPEILTTVILTTEVADKEPVSEPVEPGNASSLITLPNEKSPPSQYSAPVAGASAPFQAPPRQHRAQDTRTLMVPPPQRGAGEVPSPRGGGGIDPKVSEVRTAPSAQIHSLPNSSSGSPERGEVADSRRTEGAGISKTTTTQVNNSSIAEGGGGGSLRADGGGVPQVPWYRFFPTYVKMGFHHIMPEGIDHILFVLGLFLLSTRAKDLLKQITAFTIAHSITLALSLYGVVRLPATIVEPIIAASIVFVAVENLFTTETKAWRVYVVFLFGLVHGLGFATALQDAGLQKSGFLTALVGFNIGVELGQLSVVAFAFAAVGWFRSNASYRRAIVMPASLGIACIALFWTVQRLA